MSLRLYTREGCPHCESTKNLLANYTVEFIDVGDDPIIIKGLEAIFGTAQTPVLVELGSKKIVLGYKEDKIKGILKNVSPNNQ